MQATGKTGYELGLDVSSSFILLTMLLVAGTLSSVMASSSTRVSPDNLLKEASQKMLQLQSNPGNLHWRPQKFHAITEDDRRKKSCFTWSCSKHVLLPGCRPGIYGVIISNGNRNEWSRVRSAIVRVLTKSDDCKAGIRFVHHKYDYRRNWTTRSKSRTSSRARTLAHVTATLNTIGWFKLQLWIWLAYWTVR